MASPNPPGWSGDRFRSGIRKVYQMALPPDEEDQPLFYFPSQLIYDTNAPVDAEGVPYDPSIAVSRVIPPPVRVPCAVEYQDAQGNVTDFGILTPARAGITFLDEDYRQIIGFAYVILRGERYDYSHEEYPSGLFDVSLHTVWVKAVEQP